MTKHITRYYLFLDSNSIRDLKWIKKDFFDKVNALRAERLADVKFYLPEIVREEWMQHYKTIATKHMHDIQRMSAQLVKMHIEMDTIESMSEEEMERVCKKILTENKIPVIDTPLERIDWAELLDRAVKHQPPFNDDKDKDKGIKDAVLAQTVYDYARRHNRRVNTQVIAITNDKRLKAYIAELSSEDTPLYQFDSLDAFSSDLRLKVNELNANLQAKAEKIFYTYRDADTLYYGMNIHKQLQTKYQALLSKEGSARQHIHTLPSDKIVGNDDLPDDDDWTPIDNKVDINSTSFINRNGSSLHWVSHLTYAQVYALSTLNIHDGIVINNSTGIKHSVFYYVYWTARISNGQLKNPRIDRIDYADEQIKVDLFPGIDYESGTSDLTRPLKQFSRSKTLLEVLEKDLAPAQDRISNFRAHLEEVLSRMVDSDSRASGKDKK